MKTNKGRKPLFDITITKGNLYISPRLYDECFAPREYVSLRYHCDTGIVVLKVGACWYPWDAKISHPTRGHQCRIARFLKANGITITKPIQTNILALDGVLLFVIPKECMEE